VYVAAYVAAFAGLWSEGLRWTSGGACLSATQRWLWSGWA